MIMSPFMEKCPRENKMSKDEVENVQGKMSKDKRITVTVLSVATLSESYWEIIEE